MTGIEENTKIVILLLYKDLVNTYYEHHMQFCFLHLWKRILELKEATKGMEQLLYKTHMSGASMFREKMLVNSYNIMKKRGNLYTAGAHI